MLPEGGDAVGDLAFDRIAPDFGIRGDVEPMQVGDELRKQRQRGDHAVAPGQSRRIAQVAEHRLEQVVHAQAVGAAPRLGEHRG